MSCESDPGGSIDGGSYSLSAEALLDLKSTTAIIRSAGRRQFPKRRKLHFSAT